MIFSETRCPTVLLLRNADVKLVLKTYEGLKIPSSALRKINDVTGVYALDGNKVIFKKAEVLLKKTAIISALCPLTPRIPQEKHRVCFEEISFVIRYVIYSAETFMKGKCFSNVRQAANQRKYRKNHGGNKRQRALLAATKTTARDYQLRRRLRKSGLSREPLNELLKI
jgi:hypothetical protein